MTTGVAEAGAGLQRLARLFGVEPSYTDGLGRARSAGDEALLAILRARGAQLERPDQAEDAARARERDLWRRPLPAVAVSFDGEPPRIAVRLPRERAHGRFELQVRFEEGGEGRWAVDLGGLHDEQTAEVDGRAWVLRSAPLPDDAPWGYHRLAAQLDGAAHEALWIRAPARAAAPQPERREHAWGLFAPVYALRSERDLGCGDLTELQGLLELARAHGGGLVATLPILAAFLDEPYDPSPYSPVSRLFWNELYVDPRRAAELGAGTKARKLLDSAKLRREVQALRKLPEVDFRRCMALRRRALEALRADLPKDPEREGRFREALRREPRLSDYARFRACAERHRAGWQGWPQRERDGDLRPGDYDQDAADHHAFAQWLAEEQVDQLARRAREHGPGLYLDLPLGVHGGGYDTWRERESFAWGVAAGAPPDAFFTKGQTWGFPPLHPESAPQRGYRYTIDFLRHHLRHAGMLRIDHVMGLHRLFWVPDGWDASQGAYVRYPAEQLYAILCLESRRHGALVVGEDLGTVPDEVRPMLERRGLQRMHVVQFEARPDPEAALPAPTAGMLAALNTHDMPPFAAWWSGAEVEERLQQGLLGPDEAAAERAQREQLREAVRAHLRAAGELDSDEPLAVHAALVAHLGASDAAEVLVNLEDLWLEPRPQNRPGSGVEHGSFCRKADVPLEQAAREPAVVETLGRLARSRRRHSP